MDIQGCLASGLEAANRIAFIYSSLFILASIPFTFSQTPTVSLTPRQLIIYEGNVATFFCSSNVILDYIEWTLNGHALSELDVSNPRAINHETFGTLVFSGSEEFSNITIRCIVRTREGSNFLTSDQSTLYVQGLIPPISNLKENYISDNRSLVITWDKPQVIIVPPDTEPRIEFHVIIDDKRSPRMIVINTTYLVIPNLGCRDSYTITIRPKNHVGLSRPSVVAFPGEFEVKSRPEVPYISGGDFVFSFLVMSGMICECSAVHLEIRQDLKCVVSTFGVQSLLVSTEGLIPENQKFALQVRATNGQHSDDFTVGDLSTFDIQTMFVAASLSQSFDVETSYKLTFTGNSLAVGAFIMFLRENSEYDCLQSSFILQNKESAEEFNNFTQGLAAGDYMVRAYDIEGNGEVHSNEPAISTTFNVPQARFGSEVNMNTGTSSCHVKSIHEGASVLCSGSSETINGYTAALIRSSRQSGDTEKLSISSTTSQTTPLEVSAPSMARYCVAVFPLLTRQLQESRPVYQRQMMLEFVATTQPTEYTGSPVPSAFSRGNVGNKSQNLTLIVGVVVGALVVAMALVSMGILTAVLLFVKKRKRKSQAKQIDTDEESQGTSKRGSSGSSSRAEKNAKHGKTKKKAGLDDSEGASEDAPEGRKRKASKDASHHASKKSKRGPDILGSKKVAPATNKELVGSRDRSKSLQSPKKAPLGSIKRRLMSDGISSKRDSLRTEEGAPQSHQKSSTNDDEDLSEGHMISKKQRGRGSRGQAMSSSDRLAKKTSKRRPKLDTLPDSNTTSSYHPSTSGTTNNNDNSESGTSYSKTKKGVLADVSHSLLVDTRGRGDLQPLIINQSVTSNETMEKAQRRDSQTQQNKLSPKRASPSQGQRLPPSHLSQRRENRRSLTQSPRSPLMSPLPPIHKPSAYGESVTESTSISQVPALPPIRRPNAAGGTGISDFDTGLSYGTSYSTDSRFHL